VYYTGERLEDQRMVSLLGPALLVHNESVFSDPDFESIKRIGESSKAESGPKTVDLESDSILATTSLISRVLLVDIFSSVLTLTIQRSPSVARRLANVGV